MKSSTKSQMNTPFLSAFSSAKSRLSPKHRSHSADHTKAFLQKSPYAASPSPLKSPSSSSTAANSNAREHQSSSHSYQNHTLSSASRFHHSTSTPAAKAKTVLEGSASGIGASPSASKRSYLSPRKTKRKLSHRSSPQTPQTPHSATTPLNSSKINYSLNASQLGLLNGNAANSSTSSSSHELIATIPNLFNRKLSLKVIQKNCLPVEHACCVHSKYMWIASKSRIAIFDCLTFRPVHQITNKDTKDSVTCIQVFNKLVWTGHKSGKISVWNADTRQKVNEMKGFHKGRLNEMIQVGNTVWTASNDGSVRVWDLNTMHHLGVLPGPASLHSLSNGTGPLKYTSLVLVPDSSCVWIADNMCNIHIFSIAEGKFINQLATNFGRILRLKYTNHHVWSASLQGMVQVWSINAEDPSNSQTVKYFHCHKKAIPCLEVTNSQVWSSSLDKSMHTYDAKELKVIKNLKSKNRALWVGGMTCADNGRIWTFCSDNHIRIWSMLGDASRPSLPTQDEGTTVKAGEVNHLMEKVFSQEKEPVTEEDRDTETMSTLTTDSGTNHQSATDETMVVTRSEAAESTKSNGSTTGTTTSRSGTKKGHSSKQKTSRPASSSSVRKEKSLKKKADTKSGSVKRKPKSAPSSTKSGATKKKSSKSSSVKKSKEKKSASAASSASGSNSTTAPAPTTTISPANSPHEPTQKSKPEKPDKPKLQTTRQSSQQESLLSTSTSTSASNQKSNKTNGTLSKQLSQASTLSTNTDNAAKRPPSPILRESNHELRMEDNAAYRTPIRSRDEDIESFEALERALSHPVDDLTAKSLPSSTLASDRGIDDLNMLKSNGSAHTALLMEPFGAGDESEDSFDTGDNFSISAYEKEVMTLRQQLQEASNRISRYKERLRDRRTKLEEKQKQLLRLNDKYNQSQTELFVQKERTIELEQRIASLERKKYLDEEYTNRLLKLIPESMRNECQDVESIVWNVENIIKTEISKWRRGSDGDGDESVASKQRDDSSVSSPESTSHMNEQLEKSQHELKRLLSLMEEQSKEYQQLCEELMQKDSQLHALKKVVDASQGKDVKMETLTDALLSYSVELDRVRRQINSTTDS